MPPPEENTGVEKLKLPPTSADKPQPPPSKEELERQKLEIELLHYQKRLDLEDKKLESDVRDWYYRIATAVATAAIGVSTFFLGQYFQKRGDEAKRELEELQDQNTKFSQVLNSLGSSDPAQRLAGADALAPYVDISRRDAQATPTQIKASEEREHIAIQVLASRLISDSASRNKEEYSRVLTGVAPENYDLVLGELVQGNRLTAMRFARAVGDYAAARLPAMGSGETTCDQLPSELNARLDEVRLIVSRTEMPFESVYSDGAPVRAYLQPDALLDNDNIREYYQFQCNYVLRNRNELRSLFQSKPGGEQFKTTLELRSSTQESLAAAARDLSASTLTLLTMLRKMKGSLKSKDLQGVVIANGLLDDLDLSGANLRRCLISGSASNFKCENCDLREADFRKLNLLPGSSLNGSRTEGMLRSK